MGVHVTRRPTCISVDIRRVQHQGWTQRQAAEALDVSVARWRSGAMIVAYLRSSRSRRSSGRVTGRRCRSVEHGRDR
jgi:hypothetical protein